MSDATTFKAQIEGLRDVDFFWLYRDLDEIIDDLLIWADEHNADAPIAGSSPGTVMSYLVWLSQNLHHNVVESVEQFNATNPFRLRVFYGNKKFSVTRGEGE